MDKHVTPVQVAMSKTDSKSPPHLEQDINYYDPTELARNQDPAGDAVSPFLKTPLEIRNQIYKYLLSTKYCKVDFQDAEPKFLEELQYGDCKGVYQFHPAILTVNRQINHEASQIVRGNFFVRVTLEFKFDTNSLPVVAKEDLACRVTYPAIEVSIVDMAHSHLNADIWSFMFAGDDMATFCRILSRKYPFPGSLLIEVTGVAQTTSVLKLLERFRRVRGMASVRITGLIEGDYKSGLITKMLEEAPNGDTVLQEIQNAIKEGDQAASIHDYLTAFSRFRKAFDDTDDYWIIYDTAEVIVEKGVFKGQSFTVALAQVLVTLTFKIIMTSITLENYDQIGDWITDGARHGWKRILRSGVLKMGRVSDILAMKKLQKEVSNYADYFRACAEFFMELE